jgi:hypothetical protein
MFRNLGVKFKPNRAWDCNSRWQYSPTHFKLNVPLLHAYTDNTKYIIESVNIANSEIEIYGRLIEYKTPPPNNNIDTEYTNGS